MEESKRMSQADRELLTRIRAGDKAACAACIESHAPGVYRVALRLMRDEAEAQEVMQETFFSAFRAIDQFDGRSEIATWLYRIATNAALMRLRRARPDFTSVDDAADPDDGLPVPEALYDWCCLPEPELENAEVRAELERAIQALPDRLRAVFVLRELEGLSTEAAAAALSVSEDVVKTRLHRARLWLRERLTEYFIPQGGSPDR
jgi:RNA polymerase sigma-70 factor (ECF subfamily)